MNLLIHFLNGMLVGQPRIVHARILNPAQLKQTADDKLSILDKGFCRQNWRESRQRKQSWRLFGKSWKQRRPASLQRRPASLQRRLPLLKRRRVGSRSVSFAGRSPCCNDF
ncbi:MAG: hypothetical protein ACKOEO_11350 [Planctomycetaceae bacterium]